MGYYYDANYIRVIPIKNRYGPTITEAWKKLYNNFKKVGAALQICILDNEKSKDSLNSFAIDNIKYQLVAPYKYCNNQAERVIQIFKSHFKSCFVGVHPKFLLLE